jgi:hypothetical protein
MKQVGGPTLSFAMRIDPTDTRRVRQWFCAFKNEALKMPSILHAQMVKLHKQACQPASEVCSHGGNSDICIRHSSFCVLQPKKSASFRGVSLEKVQEKTTWSFQQILGYLCWAHFRCARA